jgi:outer membrane protein OmpA-like peptidoglycan-associated protein
VCSLNGSVVTFLTTGTCVLDANQAGAGNVLAATQVQQSVTVFAAVHDGVPSAPLNVVATSSAAGAAVSWTASSTDAGAPITGYLVRAVPGGSTCSTTGATSCDISGLTPGTSYTLSVVAENRIGDSAPGVTTYESGVNAPDSPTNVTVTDQNGTAVITWDPPSTGGGQIIGYEVTVTGSSARCSTTGATTCTVSGLRAGVSYTFNVVALSASGTSSPTKSGPTVLALQRVALKTDFAFASYSLTTHAQRDLRSFAARVKALHVRSLTLIGYTDDIGSIAYNKVLSRERAESVATFLEAQFRRMGYHSISIHERGKGVLKIAPNRARDRTVTISYS